MEKATIHPIPGSEGVHGRILQKNKKSKKSTLDHFLRQDEGDFNFF